MLLRGPRTPGELKANVGRLHSFADNDEVQEALKALIEREGGPVVAQLPRTPGRRDNEYAHLLSGPAAEVAQAEISKLPAIAATPAPAKSTATASSELSARVAALESEVTGLRQELAALKRELGVEDIDA